jgi:hypothetical protein
VSQPYGPYGKERVRRTRPENTGYADMSVGFPQSLPANSKIKPQQLPFKLSSIHLSFAILSLYVNIDIRDKDRILKTLVNFAAANSNSFSCNLSICVILKDQDLHFALRRNIEFYLKPEIHLNSTDSSLDMNRCPNINLKRCLRESTPSPSLSPSPS